MTEIIRARDLTLFVKGDSQTVAVSQAMVDLGWPGGQGVQWVASGGVDERVVTFSTGLYGGFLIWGSDEVGDRYTANTRQQPHYRYATMYSGGCLISTTSYERYTYASRIAGPLVPLVYQAQDILYLSKRGLWTKEDEMTLSGDPLAPAFYTGFVAQVPKLRNNFNLGIQTGM